MKIDELVAKLVEHEKKNFCTLAPPNIYTLNLKTLAQVSKGSWSSQLSYDILWSSCER